MDLIKVNKHALAGFNKLISLSDKLQQNQHHRAEWFDTPAKRIQWWLDLEEQWRRAFCEAVFYKQTVPTKVPADDQLQHLFELNSLSICGNMKAKGPRNNNADIDFQLTNLSGVKNLTNLKMIECDYNGLITSLEPLQYLDNLEVFWGDNNQIEDLSPLMALPNLRDLCVWNNQIKDLDPIKVMGNLKSFYLGLYGLGNPVESYEPIKSLPAGCRVVLVKNPKTIGLQKSIKHLSISLNGPGEWC